MKTFAISTRSAAACSTSCAPTATSASTANHPTRTRSKPGRPAFSYRLLSGNARSLPVKIGRLEIVYELLELLALGVFGLLVGHRLFEHDFVRDVDRRTHAQRKRDAVRGARVNLFEFAVRAHDEFGEERRLADVVYDDLLQARVERLQDRAHQIVRQRPRHGRAFQSEGDGRRFERS